MQVFNSALTGEREKMAVKAVRPAALAAVLVCLAASSSPAQLQNILSPSDFVLAVDRDLYPTQEGPGFAIDGTNTKFLSFGEEGAGFIVVPSAASAVQSIVFTTANDQEPRDPASYELYGTNDSIRSPDKSRGIKENWALISSGALSFPVDRNVLAPTVDLANTTPYGAYKMLFPMVKNATSANSMQFGEVQFYSQPGGGGAGILAAGNSILAVDSNGNGANSSYPATERPLEAIDGLKTSGSKYLNFGRENAGLIITPAAGATTVRALRLTTANDTVGRDPTTYELYGTNEAVTSLENSAGTDDNWTLISSGNLNLPGDPAIVNDQRNVEGPIIEFANSAAYTSYKILFP